MSSSVETPDWSQLPAPMDDQATRHLIGMRLSDIPLRATDGREINLGREPGLLVIYAYPRTGVPNQPNPPGWDEIPGARGCSPQSCAFRDHFQELRHLGVAALYGLSTQDTDYQCEAAERLHLPFPLLSDERLALTRAMSFPTFTTSGMTLLKRFTLISQDGVIEHVFYPVFPPDRNVTDVVAWLSSNK